MHHPRGVLAAFGSVLAIGVLALGAAAGGCKKDEPKSTRWEDAAAALETKGATAPAVPGSAGESGESGGGATVVPAGALNRYFPKDGVGGYTRVFAADKEGFAEAKLQKDGKDVGVLSISDTVKVAGARAKFDGAAEKVEGFPVVKIGNNQSSVLVADRFQVKVSSPTLDHDARKAILATFDLKGLGAR